MGPYSKPIHLPRPNFNPHPLKAWPTKVPVALRCTKCPQKRAFSAMDRAKEPIKAAPPLHQTDADEEDENVKQLRDCSYLYLSLQDCLVQTNRNWKSCQPEVQALKACHARRNGGKEK